MSGSNIDVRVRTYGDVVSARTTKGGLLIQEQGWSASKEDVLAYRLLVWSANPSNSGHTLDDAGQALGAAPDTLYGILREFWDSGLAKDTDRAHVPSVNSVFLTGTGSATAREIAVASNNVGKRRIAIRNGIVDWLNSEGGPSDLSAFLADPRGSFFGVPYSENEVEAAEDYLLDKKLITGFNTAGGLIRPKLTSDGFDCADGHSSDVQAYVNRSQGLSSTHVTVTGSTGVNVAAHSSNVTQSIAVTQETINEIQKMVESFQQSRSLLGLDAENDSKLTVLSGEILDEIALPAPDKNKLKGFLESLHSIGVSGAGSALGSVLGQAALTLMSSI
jgi:hypothetical protein